ncbi:MAG: hypothetical protein DHS80DRAFT_7165, partial [Piptocephalis tieghemiana]
DCPPPLLNDPEYPVGTASPATCINGCCLPCPFADVFYRENTLYHGYLSAVLIRAIATITSVICMISFLLGGIRRSLTQRLLFMCSVGFFVFSLPGFIVLFPSREALLCDNPILPSSLLILGTLMVACWVSILIYGLHAQVVWRSDIIYRHFWLQLIFGLGVPIFLLCMILGYHGIVAGFGNLCNIRWDISNALFFYPLAGIAFPACLIHAITLIRIFITRRRINASCNTGTTESPPKKAHQLRRWGSQSFWTLRILRQHWRVVALGVYYCFIVLFYWLFYFLQSHRLEDWLGRVDNVSGWLTCLYQGGTQDECHEVARPHIPPLVLAVFVEVLSSLTGIVFFMIFVFRFSVLRNWIALYHRI